MSVRMRSTWEKNRTLQQSHMLYKHLGLNYYIPLTLEVDFRHQLQMQVVHGVTVRAGFILKLEKMSFESCDGAEVDRWQETWDDDQPSCDTRGDNELSHDTWGDIDPSRDTWDVSQPSHDSCNTNEPSRCTWPTKPTKQTTCSTNTAEADYGIWAASVSTTEMAAKQMEDSYVCPTDNMFVYEPGAPRKLFVFNIPYRSSQRELWTFFSKFGDVEYFQLLKTTRQKSKGRGNVIYKTREEAEKVLQLPDEDLYLHGRQMFVQPSKFKRCLNCYKCNCSQQEKPLEAKDDYSLSDDTAIEPIAESTNVNICLNTDALLLVFSHLTLCERIQAERVCKHWQRVLISLWQQTVHLSFENVFPGFNDLTDKVMRSLLRRGGCSLRSIDLSRSSHFVTDRSMQAIASQCPNLVNIDMSHVAVTNLGLKKFALLAPNLQSITLKKCTEIGEMGLWWLFHKCKNLRHVDLTRVTRLRGKCLHVLCHGLQSLILNECSQLSDVGLEKISLRCKSMENLQLSSCVKLTDEGIRLITAACSTISVFNLSGSFPNLSSAGLVRLGKFVNLEELYLNDNQLVDNRLLQVLTRCEHLRLLDITSCHRHVTHGGLVSLAKCRRLQVLRMGYLHKVYDRSLQPLLYVGQLTELDARGCGELSDEVMQFACEACPDLQLLDLSGCMQITNATWQAFQNRAKQTPDKHMLLHIGGTSIIPDIAVMPTNITLNGIDHSKMDLRQDLEPDIGPFYRFRIYDDEEDGDSGDDIDEESFQLHADDADGEGFAMGNEMAEFYLDADDPLAEEEWNLS